MNQDAVIARLAERFGIAPSFRDLSGVERPTSVETKLALLQANGMDVGSFAAMREALHAYEKQVEQRLCDDEIITQAGSACSIPVAEPVEWLMTPDIDCSEETPRSGKASDNIALPGLPAGVHTLALKGKKFSQEVRIIAAPDRCPSVQSLVGKPRIWGVNTALYGLHSRTTRGMGTFQDLGLAAEAVAKMGASFLGINPVHSIGWADDVTISPYSPSHRSFLNTDHIDVSGISDLQSDARPRTGKLDHVAHQRDQKAHLETAYEYFRRNAPTGEQTAFAQYRQVEGTILADFSLYEALSEVHGSDWRTWPAKFRTSGSKACAQFAEKHQSRLEFHAWLQWLADLQLEQAQTRARSVDMKLGLYLDLAVGPRRGAAETWCEGCNIAQDVSIGAPPDHLSPAGQNWELAAYAPEQQRRAGYRSFRSLLARSLRHAGVLRIDHVLGLNRSYWIPDNGAPGGYVLQPCEALLAIVAIEASRAGTVIIGEDLGLVPDGFRDQLHRRGLYSYSVLQYEKNNEGEFRKPGDLAEQSLICFSTHDTPTLHGYLQQKDIDWWRKLGWVDNAKEIELRSVRLKEVEALADLVSASNLPTQAIDITELNIAIHSALAKSPVAMVSVQMDDAIGEVEAQNLPGTVAEHPNWLRMSALPVEEFSTIVALATIAEQMNKADR